jgi:orotate phosphoribosyltransferase
VEIASSARKHGVSDEDISHAVRNAIEWIDLDDDLDMVIGPAMAGAWIEVGISYRYSDAGTIIHAMPARPKFMR